MSTEPLTGAIWSLGPTSPFPGRYVAVAGALGNGIVVLLCTEHLADERLDDLALANGDVHWLVSRGDEPALRALSGAGPVPVLREHLAERVATLPRAMTPLLREEVRRRFAPVDSDFAEPTPDRPTIPLTHQFLEDLQVINTLHMHFFATGPAPKPETLGGTAQEFVNCLSSWQLILAKIVNDELALVLVRTSLDVSLSQDRSRGTGGAVTRRVLAFGHISRWSAPSVCAGTQAITESDPSDRREGDVRDWVRAKRDQCKVEGAYIASGLRRTTATWIVCVASVAPVESESLALFAAAVARDCGPYLAAFEAGYDASSNEDVGVHSEESGHRLDLALLESGSLALFAAAVARDYGPHLVASEADYDTSSNEESGIHSDESGHRAGSALATVVNGSASEGETYQ